MIYQTTHKILLQLSKVLNQIIFLILESRCSHHGRIYSKSWNAVVKRLHLYSPLLNENKIKTKARISFIPFCESPHRGRFICVLKKADWNCWHSFSDGSSRLIATGATGTSVSYCCPFKLGVDTVIKDHIDYRSPSFSHSQPDQMHAFCSRFHWKFAYKCQERKLAHSFDTKWQNRFIYVPTDKKRGLVRCACA